MKTHNISAGGKVGYSNLTACTPLGRVIGRLHAAGARFATSNDTRVVTCRACHKSESFKYARDNERRAAYREERAQHEAFVTQQRETKNAPEADAAKVEHLYGAPAPIESVTTENLIVRRPDWHCDHGERHLDINPFIPCQDCRRVPLASPYAGHEAIERALRVIVLDARISGWLEANDPQALIQARRALDLEPVHVEACGCSSCHTARA